MLAWRCNNSLQTVKGFLDLGRLDVVFFYSCLLPYSVFCDSPRPKGRGFRKFMRKHLWYQQGLLAMQV